MLLASSPTKEGILKAITKYYYGTLMEILEDGTIRRLSDGKTLTATRVVQKRGRWRFESVS